MRVETKAAIDALSIEELDHELNLGPLSRFQGEKLAYLRTRKTSLTAQRDEHGKTQDAIERRREFRLKSISTWGAMIAAIVSMMFGGGWYQEYQKSQHSQIEANQRIVAEYLQPVATLLRDNQTIFNDLSAEPYIEPGWGILESYLIKIRRDGVPKHDLMKKRIETLVSNNETIITLLTKYASYAKTKEFTSESVAFRDHAIRYSDRWKSLLEVYASNGNFPTAAPVFPADFPAAVQAELKVRRDGR